MTELKRIAREILNLTSALNMMAEENIDKFGMIIGTTFDEYPVWLIASQLHGACKEYVTEFGKVGGADMLHKWYGYPALEAIDTMEIEDMLDRFLKKNGDVTMYGREIFTADDKSRIIRGIISMTWQVYEAGAKLPNRTTLGDMLDSIAFIESSIQVKLNIVLDNPVGDNYAEIVRIPNAVFDMFERPYPEKVKRFLNTDYWRIMVAVENGKTTYEIFVNECDGE